MSWISVKKKVLKLLLMSESVVTESDDVPKSSLSSRETQRCSASWHQEKAALSKASHHCLSNVFQPKESMSLSGAMNVSSEAMSVSASDVTVCTDASMLSANELPWRMNRAVSVHTLFVTTPKHMLPTTPTASMICGLICVESRRSHSQDALLLPRWRMRSYHYRSLNLESNAPWITWLGSWRNWSFISNESQLDLIWSRIVFLSLAMTAMFPTCLLRKLSHVFLHVHHRTSHNVLPPSSSMLSSCFPLSLASYAVIGWRYTISWIWKFQCFSCLSVVPSVLINKARQKELKRQSLSTFHWLQNIFSLKTLHLICLCLRKVFLGKRTAVCVFSHILQGTP